MSINVNLLDNKLIVWGEPFDYKVDVEPELSSIHLSYNLTTGQYKS